MDHRSTRWRWALRAWCALAALAVTLAVAVGIGAGTAFGDEGDGSGAGQSSESAESAGTDGTAANAVTIDVVDITPVVTATSGLHVTVNIANGTTTAMPSGTFSLLANLNHTFVSRTDIQQWAEGTSGIPAPDELGSVSVAPIAAGDSATVSVDVDADNDMLASIGSWGPRPLALQYAVAGGAEAIDYTFLTRSWEGLASSRTPQLNVAIAMPLTTSQWQEDSDAAAKLLSSPATASSDPAAIVGVADSAKEELKKKDNLGSQYPALQLVGDPKALKSVSTPHLHGLMQAAGFDITAYAQIDDAALYRDAGIKMQSWTASTGLNEYRGIIGSDDAELASYAWQGDGIWTMDALERAREQGYTRVIATHDFDMQDDSTVHTSTYAVPTSAGDVTVLAAQPVLSTLASGDATSGDAAAEATQAGRIARFIAQSAFYQMEQPYTERSVLVCMGASTSASEAGALMEALGNASWLDLKDLDAIADADPYLSGDDAAARVPADDEDSDVNVAAVRSVLESLQTSREDIERFTSTILTEPGSGSPSPSASSGSGGDGDDPETEASPSASADASAQPDANGKLNANVWTSYLMQAHDAEALLAGGTSSALSHAMQEAAADFASQLLDSVSITSSNTVNVVSETASLPVTVSNALPYPVSVKVSSITDSMEIVTSRFATTQVPAKGEAQVTFTIRVSTSGTTTATEQLLDGNDQAFGTPKYTTITSALQISDKSGVAFIVIACLLGVVGLWRQFHRKKDPDE